MEGSHYCGRVAWKRLVAAREGRPLLAIGVVTSARPRFLSRAGVITGDFVTEDAGCGVVHCAPAFGEETLFRAAGVLETAAGFDARP